ncbi:MAG: YHYH protein [Pseudomonadota bacterium]
MHLTFSSLKTGMLAIGIVVACTVGGDAQQRLRVHTVTEATPVAVAPAQVQVAGNMVQMQTRGQTRVITSNGVPDHAVGAFPNAGNPNRIAAQSYRFEVPLAPVVGAPAPLPRGMSFGVAVNGVPFDPNAAEFWQGRPRSGWQYEALGGAVPLGLDAQFGHVQPTGAYHYHGLPVGLMQALGWRANAASPLIGYAADGFPIYALTALVDGAVVRMTSSYQLRSGSRPGGTAPGGVHDGAFVQDYVYVEGAGRLDACNGAFVVTPDAPTRTYAYFLTDSFPVIPRCLVGAPGVGFSKRG